MVPASSADVRMGLYGHKQTVRLIKPVMTKSTLITPAAVSTVFHPVGNTVSQRQVIKSLIECDNVK